jgi:transposase-like protein
MESAVRPHRSRRKHSPEFKAEVVQACRQSGASIGSVALAHGLNPSLVRHWLVGRKGRTAIAPARDPASAGSASGFVPVRIADSPAANTSVIHVEIRRSGAASTVVCVDWPVQQAVACGDWLRQWLR